MNPVPNPSMLGYLIKNPAFGFKGIKRRPPRKSNGF